MDVLPGAAPWRERAWGDRAWGLWAWIWFGAVAAVAWPFVAGARRTSWARRCARCAARAWLWGTRTTVLLHGFERIHAARRPWVAVANHTSKLDAVVLTAVLPPAFAFVAKAELREAAWLRWPLERLGVLFVQRGGADRVGPPQLGLAVERLRAGDSMLWFPEGRIQQGSDLGPFHRGAFVAALQVSAPVVPIAVRGTRSVLRDPSELPRRGRIEIQVGAPIETQGVAGEDALLRLLERARSFVASGCREGDRTMESPAAFDAPLR